MKGSTLLIIIGGLGGLGALYWFLSRPSGGTTVVQPAGSPTSHGKEQGILEGVASVVGAATGLFTGIINAWNDKDEQKVDNQSNWTPTLNPGDIQLK